MNNMFCGADTGVTKPAEQAIATVIANACGETCNACAASIATGAINTAVAALEMNRPTSAVTRNTTASIRMGPSDPNALTRSFAMRVVAPVFESAVASGSIPATTTSVVQLITR